MNAPYAPIAKHLASHGRGEDSVLIHMTPKEVSGLQSLAMAHGGSLTINPHTGLPEAGWLGKLLPTILGAAATVASGGAVAPWMAALAVGGGQTAITGSLTKGLMAGLGAFGGASLAGALGGAEVLGGAAADTAATAGATTTSATAAEAAAEAAAAAAQAGTALPGSVAGGVTAGMGAGAVSGALPAATPGFVAGMAPPAFNFAAPLAADVATPAILAPAASTVAPTIGAGFPSSFSEFGTRFGNAAGEGIGGAGKISTGLAATGLLGGVAGAMQPSYKMPEEEVDKYPYGALGQTRPRTAIFTGIGDPNLLTDSREREYFSREESNPYPGFVRDPNYVAPVSPNVKPRFADGGAVPMAEKDYGFNAFRSQAVPSRPSGAFNDSIGFMGSGLDYTGAISAMMAQQGVNSGSAFPGLGAPTSTTPTMPSINRPPEGGPAQGQEFDYGFKPLYGPQPTKTPNQPPPGSQQMNQPPLGVQGNQNNQRNQAAQTTQMPYPTSPGAQTNTTYPPPYMMNPMLQQYMSQNQNTSFPPPGMAAGGEALRDGAFVVDARTVSEMGNGSSGAGQELLARYGGKPIRGRGDGVSDSVRANIGGVQEARVARDEVKFEPEAVSRLGGGSQNKGAQKLYSLMAKAHKARRKAKPGQDTKLRGLLGA
jgi:hypothetical protein